MYFLELARFASIPVSLNVRGGDKVLILADTRTPPRVVEALAVATLNHGGIPVVLVVPAIEINGAEPAPPAAQAILGCDLVIGCCSLPITHSDAVHEGLRHGVRYIAMGSVSEENLTSGAATADYRRIDALTQRLADILAKGTEVHIASDAGTELRMHIKGRSAFCFSGIIREPQRIACFPDGEAAIPPVERTAHGRLVVDVSFHEIGSLSTPIVLDISEGFVREIRGDVEADMLRSIWAVKGDHNSGNVAHLSIGTNERARVIGDIQEQKKIYGGMHIGFGDNMVLGGTVQSRTHLDGIIRSPRLTIDGEVILDRNKFSASVLATN